MDKTWGFQMAQAIADRGKKEKGAGMTQDIIEMAVEAGCFEKYQVFYFTLPELEAFAKLVAAKAFQSGYEKGVAAFAEAVELEREATIKIIKETPFSNWFQADVIETIRARGEQA